MSEEHVPGTIRRGGEGRGRRREEAASSAEAARRQETDVVDVEAVAWELGNRPVDDRRSCDTKEPSNVRIFSGYKFSS